MLEFIFILPTAAILDFISTSVYLPNTNARSNKPHHREHPPDFVRHSFHHPSTTLANTPTMLPHHGRNRSCQSCDLCLLVSGVLRALIARAYALCLLLTPFTITSPSCTQFGAQRPDEGFVALYVRIYAYVSDGISDCALGGALFNSDTHTQPERNPPTYVCDDNDAQRTIWSTHTAREVAVSSASLLH